MRDVESSVAAVQAASPRELMLEHSEKLNLEGKGMWESSPFVFQVAACWFLSAPATHPELLTDKGRIGSSTISYFAAGLDLTAACPEAAGKSSATASSNAAPSRRCSRLPLTGAELFEPSKNLPVPSNLNSRSH